jgi:hypothetical protein
MMDARQYADIVVDPTIAEFESDPRSVRRAFLACVVTFHMIDYITRPTEPSARRKEFGRASPAFATIDRRSSFTHAEAALRWAGHRAPALGLGCGYLG